MIVNLKAYFSKSVRRVNCWGPAKEVLGNILEEIESGAEEQTTGRVASIRRFWKNQRNVEEEEWIREIGRVLEEPEECIENGTREIKGSD